jgi:hypothetical protein
MPVVYELEDNMKIIRRYYLGDEKTAKGCLPSEKDRRVSPASGKTTDRKGKKKSG